MKNVYRRLISIGASGVILLGSSLNATAATVTESTDASSPVAIEVQTPSSTTAEVTSLVHLRNRTGTWLYVEQQNAPAKFQSLPMPMPVYLIGPNGVEDFTMTFRSGSYLQVKGRTPLGIYPDASDEAWRATMGAFAIDLLSRGLFTKALPANAFDDLGELGSTILDPLIDQLLEETILGDVRSLYNALMDNDYAAAASSLNSFVEHVLSDETYSSLIKQILEKYAPQLNASELISLGDTFTGYVDALFNVLDVYTKYSELNALTSATFSTSYEGTSVAFVPLPDQELSPTNLSASPASSSQINLSWHRTTAPV